VIPPPPFPRSGHSAGARRDETSILQHQTFFLCRLTSKSRGTPPSFFRSRPSWSRTSQPSFIAEMGFGIRVFHVFDLGRGPTGPPLSTFSASVFSSLSIKSGKTTSPLSSSISRPVSPDGGFPFSPCPNTSKTYVATITLFKCTAPPSFPLLPHSAKVDRNSFLFLSRFLVIQQHEMSRLARDEVLLPFSLFKKNSERIKSPRKISFSCPTTPERGPSTLKVSPSQKSTKTSVVIRKSF